jgi:hypothetical protein
VDGSAHYLSLAYLAETVLVLNLAYIELKWRKELKSLKNTIAMGEWDTLSTSPATHEICQRNGCTKCVNPDYLSKYEDYNATCISNMANTMFYDPTEPSQQEPLNPLSRFYNLFKTWRHADGYFLKYILLVFHVFAKRSLDRVLSVFSMYVAVAILIFITMADNNIDVFNLFERSKVWEHSDVWKFWLCYYLVWFVVMPGVFWYLWNKFLHQYACLGITLILAYQKQTRKEINKSIENLNTFSPSDKSEFKKAIKQTVNASKTNRKRSRR